MIEILRNKNLATRFQVLVAIANSGPYIQQQEIARKLDVTPQAISDYIAQLVKNGLLASEGRSHYKVTNDGVNWIISMLRELKSYATFAEKAITNISVCTAIAERELSRGQTVGLEMKNGLLFATSQVANRARGVATADAKKGDDVGVTEIKGIVKLQIGTVTILRVPGIGKGGSRNVDLTRLRAEVKGRPFIGALGIEALVTLKRLKLDFHRYGTQEATIEAAYCGLQPAVVCVEDEISGFIKRLEEADIDYKIVDIAKN